MESINKMKIVWLSSVDTEYLKNCTLPFIRNYRPSMLAPWIGFFLDELKKRSNLELHVVAYHQKLKQDYDCCEDGIHYYFLTQKMPFLRKTYPWQVSFLTRNFTLRRKVAKLLNKLQPDLVHLHGSDFSFASCVTNIKYPVLLTPSTFINHLYEYYPTKQNKFRLIRENRCLRKVKFYGIRANFMKELILSKNPSAKFFWHAYPIAKIAIRSENYPSKDADLVFAARLDPNKGIADLLHAIEYIKNNLHKELTLKIVGSEDTQTMKYVLDMIDKLGIHNNVIFKGFQQDQDNFFIEIAKAKIYVLPTHFDMIPGTILESMAIGTPVITYPVGGIPDLNIGEQRVVFSPVGDIESLARNIVDLLNNESLRNHLVNKSRQYVLENWDSSQACDDLINAYKSIITEAKH